MTFEDVQFAGFPSMRLVFNLDRDSGLGLKLAIKACSRASLG